MSSTPSILLLCVSIPIVVYGIWVTLRGLAAILRVLTGQQDYLDIRRSQYSPFATRYQGKRAYIVALIEGCASLIVLPVMLLVLGLMSLSLILHLLPT